MPGINDDEMLSAVSAAIDGDAPPEPTVDNTEAEGGEETQAGVEGEPAAVEEGTSTEESTPEGEVEATDPVTGEARARGPDGKFVKKPAKEEAAAEPKPPEAKEKQAAAQPAKKDPVNDPIPDNLKKETKERMVSLVEAVKSQASRADQAAAERDDLLKIVMDTGANVEQYSQALNYLKMVNSSDPAQIEQAIGFLQSELTALSKAVGKPVPGVDLLADHADLRQHVVNGTMTEETAAELAGARERQRHQNAVAQRQRQQSNQETQQQDSVNAGRQALNAVGARLQKDPQFEAKNKILTVVLKPAIAASHPSKWAEIYESAYTALELPKASAPRLPGAVSGVPANQPMRGKAPSGGAQKAPGSLLEAINFGLEEAAR